MELAITSHKAQAGITLQVTGEADVSCADRLRSELDAALAEKPAKLVVDLSGLSYIDSTGIGTLVAAAHHATDASVPFSVENPQRNVARVFSLLGVSEDLGVKA